MKEEKKINELAPLPPNFADLDPEMKKVVEEQIYKQQLHNMGGFHLGDPALVSGPGLKKMWIKEEE